MKPHHIIYSCLKKIIHDWEKEDYTPDKFDLQFDENGNFIPPKPEEFLNVEVNDLSVETQNTEEHKLNTTTTNTLKKHDFIINYVIKNEEE